MKKLFPVIIGVLIGSVISTVLIINNHNRTAYSEINAWNEAVAYGDFFNWNDVFSPSSKGEDLYFLVYNKLFTYPERDALKDVAQKYGLTKEEAQAVIDGSVTPIFHSPRRRSAELTIEDAYVLATNLQNDFADISEIFEIQQEVDVAISPSEIFSNGDLGDSGFDLIHDLTVIEEILFLEKTENTVGKSFGNQLDSPYQPTEAIPEEGPYVATEGMQQVYDISFYQASLLADEIPDEGAEEGAGQAEAEEKAQVYIGDEVIEANILEEDVCPSDDDLNNALDNYQEETAEKESGAEEGPKKLLPGEEPSEGGGGTGESEDLDGDGEPDYKLKEEALVQGGLGDDGKLSPAKGDDWLKSWCPALESDSSATGASAGSTFGDAGWSSLGDVVSSLIGQSVGTGAYIQTEGLSVQIAICLEIEARKKKVSSYQPGESCILCEVEKINELMDKTLSHSIVANKATGNIFESAKCKDAYGALLDMQVIVVQTPVSTPPNDDVIYGRNIYEEWKKFVDRYEPLLYPSVSEVTQFETTYVQDNTTQLDLINSVTATLDSERSDALREIEDSKTVETVKNVAIYIQEILKEIRQMNGFFEGYNKQYNKINDVCNSIKAKKNE